MSASEERLLSLEEVADRLHVSGQSVRRWIKSGRLRAYKPGLEWRIAPEDLDEFLESRSSPKVQAPSPDTAAARREELAATLADNLAERGERYEETLKAKGVGVPTWLTEAFIEWRQALELLYEEIATARRPSAELQAAKARLDAVGARISKLAYQKMHANAKEERTLDLFAERQREQQKAAEEKDAGPGAADASAG